MKSLSVRTKRYRISRERFLHNEINLYCSFRNDHEMQLNNRYLLRIVYF